ncbi:MAG: gliding motility-associated-like protein [Crocinitomix sp.]|jgi:gliding motility-associated-like protein
MFLIKNLKPLLILAAGLFFGANSFAQLEGGNAYLIGDFVNIAVDGGKGKEGTAEGAGFHYRGGAGTVPCGFVSDPLDTGWDPSPAGHDGDFFTPGSPENGFGLQIAGVDYANNAGGADSDIIAHVGFPLYYEEGDCITVEWEGEVDGVTINVKYHLIRDQLYYTTEITLINGSGIDQTDLYYYRNVDPDNNQSIGGTFVTTNTIVSQPGDDCQKSLVSAEQSSPHDSYLGFGALGDKFRVSHGGFSNRSASDIWDGTGGLTGTIGAVAVADQAISLAWKDDLDIGDTVGFTFAVVLSEAAVEGAFSSLYYIDYESAGGIGGGIINQCSPIIDSALSCAGNPVTLTVDGPNADDYDWVWTSDPLDPDAPLDGPVIVVSPDETTSYTVTGTPISDCLTSSITKTIVVVFTEGPDISIVDPGPYCEDFDINDLVFEDLNDTEDPNIVFLTEFPDSSTQTEPEFEGPLMGPDDEVWLMIGDPDGGCFDAILIEIDFGGLGAAGDDSTIALCGTPETIIDLHDLIEEGANPLGDFDEITFSGQFNEATGEFDVDGLAGTYTFSYTVEGLAPCPDDEATFTVIVYGQPNADFEYEVDGISSADGLGSTCIINEVDFFDFSTIPAPAVITGWDWDFGGDGTSTLENPSHTFSSIGTYTITLTVSTDDGCTHTYTKEIIIYTEPILDVIFNDPTCFGFTDGSITAFVAGGSGTFDIEILNSDGVQVNIEGSNTANTLPSGTYTVNVVDGSGCTASATIIITDPIALVADYTVVDPLCFGDPGYVVIHSVTGEDINNPMAYFWAPETDVPNGFDADSVNINAGDYSLTINDSHGCSVVIDITMNEPDELYFNEDTGYDPAYCRLFGFQNGNGQVYASASGGTPDYDYIWTDVATGETTDNTTWGGRNPGDYTITATDANGCIISQTITVDSLNPIAAFTVNSDQLNEDCKGTGPVDVEFTNTSLYFANPNNPLADPRFFWNLDSPQGDWYITGDYDEKVDTIYGIKGVSYIMEVCLVAQNKNGCTDTACKIIEIFEPYVFVPVNIFTPNGDGDNDIFTFREFAASVSTFECVIVNRWGIQVGEFSDITSGWDGTDMNGDACNDGVYFYTYRVEADNGENFAGQGTVNIAGSKQ